MELCVLSDFDGTITEQDGLYTFIKTYALNGWEDIENSWSEGKISSKECLIEEFKLIPNLSEGLIDRFTSDIKIDEYFLDFYKIISDNNIDFFVVSDGLDFFINKILANHGLSDIKIISNHAEFIDGNFKITFPNDSNQCLNNAGTCKCKILSDLKNQYNKIIYIGDGVSDYCVADKADILFAKLKLADYCKKNNIKHEYYNDFSDIIKSKILMEPLRKYI